MITGMERTIYCSDVAEDWPEEFKRQGGCCQSCHEDEFHGYELMEFDADSPSNTTDRRVYVCCAASRAMREAGVLKPWP